MRILGSSIVINLARKELYFQNFNHVAVYLGLYSGFQKVKLQAFLFQEFYDFNILKHDWLHPVKFFI